MIDEKTNLDEKPNLMDLLRRVVRRIEEDGGHRRTFKVNPKLVGPNGLYPDVESWMEATKPR